jgi:MoaD family protein
VTRKVSVHYLAQLRAAVGVADETVELPADATLADLVARLAERHGERFARIVLKGAAQPHDSILLFVNDEQVAWQPPRRLREGDAVTVLTPMAGG